MDELFESELTCQAFYSMENPTAQIQSFVENSLRTIVPTMELDHLFLEKQKISGEIKDDLGKDGIGSFV